MHKCFREVRCPQRTNRVSPFRIIHYSLYIIHYSLSITHYLLSITHYSLLIIHYTLSITHYPLSIIHYTLSIIPLITVWITVEKPIDNLLLIHRIQPQSFQQGISTAFCNQWNKVFHAFAPKKDINLLSLHSRW